ncbi:MAG: pantoate--beta-alanine ligase [Phycisphaerae bacterium]
MKVVTCNAELLASLPSGKPGCHFVPTMGALHEGHQTLIRVASAAAAGDEVAVSIFVNPTQFDDPSDLSRYPRTLAQDLERCREAGATLVYAPSVEDVYPPGEAAGPTPIPEQATRPGLEDGLRPGHFAGVCQVVRRLFELVRPRAAYFGEKDWQQLQVIAAMTSMCSLPVRIVPVPTVRESDGLAMSSRNRFLSTQHRRQGLSLSMALCEAQRAATPAGAEAIMDRVLHDAGLRPDYAVVRDAATLLPRNVGGTGPMRALIAARVGAVRLIDNAAWVPGTED